GFGFGNTGLVNGVTPKYWDSSGNYVNDTTINDTISGDLGRGAGEDVGRSEYNIGRVEVSDAAEYGRSLTPDTFAITPAPLIITATAVYNLALHDALPISGFGFGNTGLVNGVTPKYWDSSGNYVNDTTINDTISGDLGRGAGEDVG